MDWILKFYFDFKNTEGEYWNFRIFKKNEGYLPSLPLHLPLKGVGAIFSTPTGEGPIPELPVNRMDCDINLESYGLEVGGSIYIENSNTNDGRWFYVDSFFATGNGTYPYGVYFTQQTGLSFYAETDTDFDVTIEGSKRVDFFEPTTKWGEELNQDESDITDKFKPIQQSHTTIELFDDSGSDYEDIFLKPNGQYRLEVYKGAQNYDTPFWIGVSFPSIYEKQIYGGRYLTTITFTDGLNLAGKKRFHIGAPDSDRKLITLLRYALNNGTGIEIDICESVNLFMSGMDEEEGDTPLEQLYRTPSRYYLGEYTFRDVITDICEEWGCRLMQWDGKWHLMRIPDLSGQMVQRTWNENGQLLSSEWVNLQPTPVAQTYGDREANFIQTYLKAGSVKVTAPGGPRLNGIHLNRIPNGYFEDWVNGVPVNWNNNGLTIDEVEDAFTGSKSMRMLTTGPLLSAPTNYIETTTIEGGEGKIRIRVRPQEQDGTSDEDLELTELDIVYSLRWGNSWWTPTGWSSTEALNTVNNGDPQDPDYNPQKSFGAWLDLEISDIDWDSFPEATVPTIPDIILRIYDIKEGSGSLGKYYVIFDSVELITDGADASKSTYLPDYQTPLVKEFGDIEKEIIGEYAHNFFHYRGQDETEYYNRLDGPGAPRGISDGGYPLRYWIAQGIYDESKTNQESLMCEINSEAISLPHTAEFNGKRFMCNGVTLDYSKARIQGQWIQLISTPRYLKP